MELDGFEGLEGAEGERDEVAEGSAARLVEGGAGVKASPTQKPPPKGGARAWRRWPVRSTAYGTVLSCRTAPTRTDVVAAVLPPARHSPLAQDTRIWRPWREWQRPKGCRSHPPRAPSQGPGTPRSPNLSTSHAPSPHLHHSPTANPRRCDSNQSSIDRSIDDGWSVGVLLLAPGS
jgi:hypothetical protein